MKDIVQIIVDGKNYVLTKDEFALIMGASAEKIMQNEKRFGASDDSLKRFVWKMLSWCGFVPVKKKGEEQ